MKNRVIRFAHQLKQLFRFAVVFIALAGCSSKEPIQGTIEGTISKGMKVYLIQPQKLQAVAAPFLGTVIDSSTVQPDGSFAFTMLPESEAPMLLEMALQPEGYAPNQLDNKDPLTSNYMPVIWQTGEQLTIMATATAFQQMFTLENPSEANKDLLELRDIKLKAYKTYLQDKQWNVEDGSQLLEKEKAHLNYQHQLMAFAEATHQFLPAMVALRWTSPENDYERIPEFLFNQCAKWQSQELNSPWVDQLCEQSKKSNLPVLQRDQFPDANLPLVSGSTLSLYENLGSKLTIIDLWASWCAPCRKENREVLVPLWNAYNKQGLQIIGYGLESDRTAWEEAIVKDGAQVWPQTSHLQGDDAPFLKTLRIQTIPANFILDASGKVLAKNLHGEDLVRFVQDYLKN